MFLSVKEMELRKVRFDETLQPGQIDFVGENLVQSAPLHAVGVAEYLEHSDGELRIQGRYTVELSSQCVHCLAAPRFPWDAALNFFFSPLPSSPAMKKWRSMKVR